VSFPLNILSAGSAFPELSKVMLQTSVSILVTDIQLVFILKILFKDTLSSTQAWLLTSRYLTGKQKQVMSAQEVLGFLFVI